MTNEKKERLKGLVENGFSWIESRENPNKQDYKDIESILALIDNVPSEDEANQLWDALKFSLCSIRVNRKDYSCNKCGTYFTWRDEGGGWDGTHGQECIISTLRKALNIEEELSEKKFWGTGARGEQFHCETRMDSEGNQVVMALFRRDPYSDEPTHESKDRMTEVASAIFKVALKQHMVGNDITDETTKQNRSDMYRLLREFLVERE